MSSEVPRSGVCVCGLERPRSSPPHPMAPPSPSTNSSSNHSSSNSSGEQLSKTNLYIRGLPPGTTDQDLIKLCQPLLSAAWICERGKTEHWKINTYLKAVF
ncbi:hypothetical protein FD755_010606 [Muntiacus reevesi]|uniref:RRM domain-containing protein n=1 Tax=Muntiacus reevesi TaxID=9886 RepID=A0A5N3Y0L2_MUNRE|nr:hypothetical protein FD755_010606 [Muntiacus reevesi]